MKNLLNDKELIENLGRKLGGVLTVADLETALGEKHSNQFYRRIRALESHGVLERFLRGFYTTPGFDAAALCHRIQPDSYLSFSSILSEAMVIGTKPRRLVEAVIPGGKSREHSHQDLRFDTSG